MGGSADRRYNMSFLVQNSVDLGTPMIGVSLNYRLSAFGFLQGKEALEAGSVNIGFKDQRLALRVRVSPSYLKVFPPLRNEPDILPRERLTWKTS
jgi:hypothetical protein